MGANLCWLAIEGDPSPALDLLGLTRSGRMVDYPHAGIGGVALASGWFVLARRLRSVAQDQTLAGLSAGREILVGDHIDGAGGSALALWKDGALSWRVEHLSDTGALHLDITGRPPGVLDDIQREVRAKAGEAIDLFEVPVRLGMVLCGYAPESYFAVAPGVARDRPYEEMDGKESQEPGVSPWRRLARLLRR